MEQKEIDNVFKKYQKATNMSFDELLIWSKNPISKKASLSRSPIRRNLDLLAKPKSKWGAREVDKANRTISYLARAKGIEQEYKKNNPKDKTFTPNRIAMRNWGFDVFKDKKYLTKKPYK